MGGALDKVLSDVEKKQKKKLDLNGKGISELPGDKIAEKLISVEELDLGKNKLTRIPPEIGQLLNLHVLILEKNNLEEVPSTLGLLIELRVLDLKENKLTRLPAELSKLKHLNTLHLQKNPIASLPLEFSVLTSLETISLKGTVILKQIPRDIIDKGAKAVVKYLSELKAKSSKIELRDEDSIVGPVGKMDKFEDDNVDSGVGSITENKSNPESKENSPRKEEKDKEDLSKSEKKR